MNSYIEFFADGWTVGDARIYDNGVISLCAGRYDTEDNPAVMMTIHYLGNNQQGLPQFFVTVSKDGRVLDVSDYENTFGIRCHKERHAPTGGVRMEFSDLLELIKSIV